MAAPGLLLALVGEITLTGTAAIGARTPTVAIPSSALPSSALPSPALPSPELLLSAELGVLVTLLDQALPRHPSDVGRSHLGLLLTPTLALRPHPRVELAAGARVRVPMTLDLEEEAAAIPYFALVLRPPMLEGLTLRFGSYGPLHGYHPALVHEARVAYGRELGEEYDRSLSPPRGALSGAPAMPVEHGARLSFARDGIGLDAFLDWQLLETLEHREKFAVGALFTLGVRRLSLSGQLRLDHYGGERYTKLDPMRRAGLDPTRQDLALAAIARGRPLELAGFALELSAAVIAARPTRQSLWRAGLELGAELLALDAVSLGWRWWRALDALPGPWAEPGDPSYRQAETQRVFVALAERVGPVELRGRFDLVFPRGGGEPQYELATTAAVDWSWPIPLSRPSNIE